jgi:hypothetical protein
MQRPKGDPGVCVPWVPVGTQGQPAVLGLRGEVLKLAPAGLKQSHFLIPASLRSSAHTQGLGPRRAIATLGAERLAALCRELDSRLRGNDA